MNTYTTLQGDSWDSICYRLYGEERLAHRLLQANPAYMDVLIFAAGLVLELSSAAEMQLPSRAQELPPWM